MDKEICNVGTQYIICECGDNFPNEKFLNKHLANGHAEVETFQCDVCPEVFTSANSLAIHISTHRSDKPETSKKLKLKTYSRKSPLKEIKVLDSADLGEAEVKLEQPLQVKKKKPPVIKLKNLKRIDSISLIENLKAFGGFIKIEPLANTQEPESQTEPELPEPQPEPEPELPEPEPELPEPEHEAEPESIFMEIEEEEGQVIVKNEKQEAAETEEEREEIYYQCDVCNSIFYTEWDFNVHYQSAHALKLEPGAGTPERSLEQSLERHLVTDHADDEGVQAETTTAYYYECELCHKIFASEKYFNIHYNKTHAQPAVAEPAEDEVTEASSEPAAPAEEAKPKGPEQVIYYKCDLCKILYPSEKAYNIHFEKKHGGQSYQELQTGFQLIEQELTEEYECPSPPPDVIACEFCSRTFTMKRSLQVHRKRIHPELIQQTEQAREPARSASRSKVCDVCGRAYNSNAALRYHQRRHTGERPYACNMCPKRFTMPMFLQIHTRTHTGEKPYECPHCPKAFTNKAALIRHDRIHTGERPFKCTTCGKGFISKAMLNRHVRVHTGVKPYACPECGKMFTQSNSMKLHVSTVHLKLPAPYKSRSRRNKSEARALQQALKNLPQDEFVLGIKLEDGH